MVRAQCQLHEIKLTETNGKCELCVCVGGTSVVNYETQKKNCGGSETEKVAEMRTQLQIKKQQPQIEHKKVLAAVRMEYPIFKRENVHTSPTPSWLGPVTSDVVGASECVVCLLSNRPHDLNMQRKFCATLPLSECSPILVLISC